MSTQGPSKFEEQAAKAGGGVFAEFWIFLKENKKLVPHELFDQSLKM